MKQRYNQQDRDLIARFAPQDLPEPKGYPVYNDWAGFIALVLFIGFCSVLWGALP